MTRTRSIFAAVVIAMLATASLMVSARQDSIFVPWADELVFSVEFDDGSDYGQKWAMPPFQVGDVVHFRTVSHNRTIYNGGLRTWYFMPNGAMHNEFQMTGAGGTQQCATTWVIQPGDNSKQFVFILEAVVWGSAIGPPIYTEAHAFPMTLEVMQ